MNAEPTTGCIAVTGASGLLGRAVVSELCTQGHAVVAGIHSRSPAWQVDVATLCLDLTDASSVNRFIADAGVTCVIHCAAMTHVDGCETDPSRARALNVDATRRLVDAVGDRGTQILYLSTDFVFDGLQGPYDEDATPNPINIYGQTKLEGEAAICQAGENHAVIRSAGFLGHGTPDRPTFVELMAQTMRAEPPVRVAANQRSNITAVPYLASAIVEIAERRLGGVWHVAGSEIVSRYDFAMRLAGLLRLPITAVEEVEYAALGRAAARPLQGGLIATKAERELSCTPPTLDAALAEWVEEQTRF